MGEKPIIQSKTMVASGFSTILGVILILIPALVGHTPDWLQKLSEPQVFGAVLTLQGLVFGWLRTLTSQPLKIKLPTIEVERVSSREDK
jgi:VIT1/CCC1 family predicted Fe2+/Mn2+ transporter